jgi:hypothetical protein
MARYKNLVWTSFIARLLAMLTPDADKPGCSSGSDLNTQDHREYRQNRQSTVGNEELAWPETGESLQNLRW